MKGFVDLARNRAKEGKHLVIRATFHYNYEEARQLTPGEMVEFEPTEKDGFNGRKYLAAENVRRVAVDFRPHRNVQDGTLAGNNAEEGSVKFWVPSHRRRDGSYAGYWGILVAKGGTELFFHGTHVVTADQNDKPAFREGDPVKFVQENGKVVKIAAVTSVNVAPLTLMDVAREISQPVENAPKPQLANPQKKSHTTLEVALMEGFYRGSEGDNDVFVTRRTADRFLVEKGKYNFSTLKKDDPVTLAVVNRAKRDEPKKLELRDVILERAS